MSSKHLVDPELAPLLDLFPDIPITTENLAAMRAASLAYPSDPNAPDRTDVSMRTIPGPAGAPDLPIAIYRPRDAAGQLPCIFHIHGGGYIAGSAGQLAGLHRAMATELNCVITSVDYRLAPETRFPGAIEDCYAALGWVFANAATLGVDVKRVGVMGESAGGGLASALALMVRDRGAFTFAFQHLIYPMIDDRTCVTKDPNAYVGEFIWTPQKNLFGWTSLLGVAPGSEGVSPYAAAARAENLAGLPPTYISTGALDLFLDEDLDYARRLMRAGVPVELHVFPGAFHGFELVPGARVALAAISASRTALKHALHPA